MKVGLPVTVVPCAVEVRKFGGREEKMITDTLLFSPSFLEAKMLLLIVIQLESSVRACS